MELYDQRIVAYADILGWGNACGDLSKFPRLQAAALAIADYARKFSPDSKAVSAGFTDQSGVNQHETIEFSFFSDNFVVSGLPNQVELVFKILAFASHELLRSHFLVRGGVTIGSVYHKNNVLFGPALIEAVELEKEANYPRLLCSQRLSQFMDVSLSTSNLLFKYQEQVSVVNIAIGSHAALIDLNAIILDEVTTLKEHTDKWSYLQEMLPKMYKCKGIE